MKINKRIFAIVMSVLMLIAYMPGSAYAEGGNIAKGTCGTCEWVIDANGVLSISSGTMDDWGENPPWYDYMENIFSARATGPVQLSTCQKMFYYCEALANIDVSNFDTSKVTNMSNMFSGCKSLTSLDVSNFDTSKVTNMSSMFSSCESLTKFDLRNFDTSKVTDMSHMFLYCGDLLSLDLSSFDTSNVTNMQDMFGYCCSLTNINISSFNTSNVTDMWRMFGNCQSLTSLDISSFDTSKVTNMSNMFFGCESLINLDLSNFDTSKVEDMERMFYFCESLADLNLSKLNTGNVTNMSTMFESCKSLTRIDVSNFDTSKVTNMSNMFSSCYSLTNLDLSNFDTSKVTDMGMMFYDCSSLTNLDLSSFDTSQVTDMFSMLNKCYALEVLKIGKWITHAIYSHEAIAKFPVRMTDKSTGEVYEAGTEIPAMTDRTYVAEASDYFEGYVSFNYRISYNDKEGTSEVYYTDDFFSKSNSKYNHELATTSLGMAMAGMNNEYISAFLTRCGFSEDSIVQSERYGENNKEDEDKVAYTFASKQINGETIIAVSLRGGDYGYEWGSNGRVGESGIVLGYHYGFNKAADDVITNLKNYSDDLNDSIIWITGYSRSAAVANCVSEKLEKNGDVKKTNLYCYDFATPRTVTEEQANNNVQGIFNIVNPLDLVPNVPLNSSTWISYKTKSYTLEIQKPWDYTRHGTTLELPSAFLDAKYGAKLKEMESIFLSITNNERAYIRFNGMALQYLLDVLAATTQSEQNYVRGLQDSVIVPVLEKYMGKRGTDKGMLEDNELFQVLSCIPGFKLLLEKKYTYKDLSLMKQHWPETYLAWMMTRYEPKEACPIKAIITQCPVDVEVYDSDGVLVAHIVNDVVDESYEGRLEAYVDEAGAKTVFMPTDAEYTVSLTATDGGEMTYSVIEFSEDKEVRRKVMTESISLENGKEFTGKVNGELNTDAENYALESNGEIITPDKDLSGDRLNNIEISVEIEGDGVVMGEGLYTIGDSVVLDSAPICNNAFEGWYSEDGTLLSKDNTLTSVADKPAKYKAVFTKASHEYGEWTVTKEATCTEEGSKEAVCSICGCMITEAIPATGHKWDTDYTIDIPATEAAPGSKSIHCSVCGAIKEGSSEVIPQRTPSTPSVSPVAPAEIVDLPAVKISKPKAAKKKITVKWKKVSKKNLKKIEGIQIQVATDPGFTNIVKTATAGKKKTSKTIKGLSPKTKYYVRIRAYAAGNHVSAWKSKSVKVK